MGLYVISEDEITTTLEDAIKASPAGTTSLYIHSIVYDALTVEDIKAGFRAIPSPINQINIDGLYSDSDGRFRDKINEIYAALPSTITSVSLDRFDELHDDNIGAITDVIKNLPRTIKRLSFSGSNLGRNSVKYIRLLFQALPEGIFELELDGCSLDELNTTDLTTAFLVLPNHLTTLELDLDEFGHQQESDLKKIFLALPLSELTSLTSECSSIFNRFLVELLQTFVDEVQAGFSSKDKIMSDIQRKAIDLRQSGLSDDKKNLIRRELSLLGLKQQLLEYSADQAKSSEYFLAEWLQSASCTIENKQLLAVWSLYLSLKNRFSYQTRPINFIALAELDFDNPTRFCAFLLWALDIDIDKGNSWQVQNSGILEHFFTYHLSYLGCADTALHEVYRILKRLRKVPGVGQLLDYANKTHSCIRGAKVNYPLISEAGLYTWQSSNLAGDDFEHDEELVVNERRITELPRPMLPETPGDIVKLYRWFGIEMLKHLNGLNYLHHNAFKSILMSDEGDAIREALPAVILRGEIPLESAVRWLHDIVEVHGDINALIATNPFYLYAIIDANSSVLDQLEADPTDQCILALQRQVSDSAVNSVSILLWVVFYVRLKQAPIFPIQQEKIKEFIFNQALRFTSELPDDVYSVVRVLDISNNFMLDKLNLFKQELIASFCIDNFEASKLKWGELRAQVYNILALCPQLRDESHYPANIYEFKAFYIEEAWRHAGENFDLNVVLSNIGAFDENQDDIHKRVVLEALLFTKEPALQALFIQHLNNHHIDWVNEKFGDELFLLEKSMRCKNAHLIVHILNFLEDNAPINYHSKIVADLVNSSTSTWENVSEALITAVLTDKLNIVKHLIHLSGVSQDTVTEALLCASNDGRWSIVKYLCSLNGANRPERRAVLNAVDRAFLAEKWDVVTCWLDVTGDNGPFRSDVSLLLNCAAKMGQESLIPHLLSLTGACQLRRENIIDALFQAACTGKLHIVTLFIELTGDKRPNCNDVSGALSLALDSNEWGVVSYLLSLTGDNKPIWPVVMKALSHAVEKGHTGVLTQLVHLSREIKPTLGQLFESLCAAATKKQWAIVNLLFKFPLVDPFLYTHEDGPQAQGRYENNLAEVLACAAASGQLDIVIHLIQLYGENDTVRTMVGHALRSAAMAGQLNVVDYILHLPGHNKPDIETIHHACTGCQLNTATSLRDFLKTFSVDDFVDAYYKNPNILKSVDLSIAKTLVTTEKLPGSAFEFLPDSAKNDPEIICAVYNENPNILTSVDLNIVKMLLTTVKLPGSAFEFLSDSAKNDPEIICAVYNENPDLLLPGLSDRWSRLFNSIDHMRIYGEYLLEEDAKKGNVCIELAATLKSQAFTMVKSKHDASLLEQSILIFTDILTSKKKEMGVYRMNVDTLITNIIIAVISLPILCLPILIKLLHSYQTESRFLFFGQSSKTTREEKLGCIQSGIEQVEEEYELPGPP